METRPSAQVTRRARSFCRSRLRGAGGTGAVGGGRLPRRGPRPGAGGEFCGGGGGGGGGGRRAAGARGGAGSWCGSGPGGGGGTAVSGGAGGAGGSPAGSPDARPNWM